MQAAYPRPGDHLTAFPRRRGWNSLPVGVSLASPRCVLSWWYKWKTNTDSTESREIRYPWHPWCGRSVWIHRTVVKGGRTLYRCSPNQNHEARLFEVPQWMFESDACCQGHSAEKPAANCAALLDLKLFLHRSRSHAGDLVLQAQHCSSQGGTDATIYEPTAGSTNRIVSPATADSVLAKSTARNQTEDGGTTGATAARTPQENPGLPARKGGWR